MQKSEDIATFKTYMDEGIQLKKEANLASAIEKFSQALQLNPDFIPALNQLARIYESRKEFEQAITYYKHIIQLQPANGIAHARLAKAMMAQKNIQRAITLYQKAIALQPDQPAGIYVGLGNALNQNGQIDEAISAYQKAIEIKPDNSIIYAQLARAMMAQKNIQEAIANYQKAIALQPEQPLWVYHELGNALNQNGQLEEGISAYQKAIKLNLNRIQDYMAIDKILRELGRLEEANKYYYHSLKTTPEIWEEEYILRLRVGQVRNGILIPFSNRNMTPPHQAGIKTNRNCPPYFYHLRKNFQPTTDINYLEQQDHQPSAKLHGTYLYAGFAFRHFGHYMAECTHRLWAYSKLSSQIKGVVFLPESKNNIRREFHKLSPFMEQAITYMQIPLENVHSISEVTEVEHLIVPEQASSFKNNLKLSSNYIDFLSENEEKFFHSYKSQNSDYAEKL